MLLFTNMCYLEIKLRSIYNSIKTSLLLTAHHAIEYSD